jgi:hypothetical protein
MSKNIIKDAMEYKDIDNHIATMYKEVYPYIDEHNTNDCLMDISKAATLCKRLGGRLVSRQVFATIVSPYIEYCDV